MKSPLKVVLTTFLLFANITMSQDISVMTKNTHEAWTVEYFPYKLTIQDAVSKYKGMKFDGALEIPHVKINDKIIIVRSFTNKNVIYEMWYGNDNESMTKLNRRQIEWIFGETVRKTLINRDEYYNLDTDIVFNQKPNQEEFEYIVKSKYWVLNDMVFDIPGQIQVPFGDHYNFCFKWGNELIGLPYGSLGQMSMGVKYKYFDLGVLTPSFLHFTNGYMTDKDDGELDRMTSGFGSYGSFNSKQFAGFLSFASSPMFVDGVDTNSVYSSDFTFQINGILEFDNRFIPFFNGTVLFNPGLFSMKISKGQLFNSIGLNSIVGSLPAAGDYSYLRESSEYYWGFYFRTDIIGDIPQERDFPRYIFSYQLHTGVSMLTKVIFNFNENIGISITNTTRLDTELIWARDGTYLGLILNYDLDF